MLTEHYMLLGIGNSKQRLETTHRCKDNIKMKYPNPYREIMIDMNYNRNDPFHVIPHVITKILNHRYNNPQR